MSESVKTESQCTQQQQTLTTDLRCSAACSDLFFSPTGGNVSASLVSTTTENAAVLVEAPDTVDPGLTDEEEEEEVDVLYEDDVELADAKKKFFLTDFVELPLHEFAERERQRIAALHDVIFSFIPTQFRKKKISDLLSTGENNSGDETDACLSDTEFSQLTQFFLMLAGNEEDQQPSTKGTFLSDTEEIQQELNSNDYQESHSDSGSSRPSKKCRVVTGDVNESLAYSSLDNGNGKIYTLSATLSSPVPENFEGEGTAETPEPNSLLKEQTGPEEKDRLEYYSRDSTQSHISSESGVASPPLPAARASVLLTAAASGFTNSFLTS